MRLLLIGISVLALGACSIVKPDRSQKDMSPKEYVEGEVLVKGSENAVKALFENNYKSEFKGLTTVDKDNDVYKVSLVSEGADLVPQIVEELNEQEGIEFAEPNYIVTVDSIERPKDPFWLKQWALKNIGQDAPSGSQGEVGADIGVTEAWKLSKGSKDIIVGVIDTGIDYKHPDLKDNMWENELEKNGLPGVDDDKNGYTDDVYGWNFISAGVDEPYYGQLGKPDPMDDNSHGSHCAGIIGAVADNSTGISGVNWNVQLMALKFLSASGSGSSEDAYRAVIYGINNGAHILSNSWGGGPPSKLMKFGIEQALAKGVVFVAAAGNSNSNNDLTPHFPSNYQVDNVISVAATDNKDRRAQFSCYGVSTVHIAAPGVSIMSTIPVAKSGGGYKPYAAYSGTSMATPYVAGAAALLMAHETSLRRDPVAVKKRLMDTVDTSSHLSGFVASGGRLNVHRALTNDVNPEADNTNISAEPHDLKSPRYPRELIDKTWVITKPGAKRIRVNFSYVMADVPNYDIVAIYDKSHHLVFNFEDKYPMGFTSPWVEGDTVRVRFANSLVSLVKVEVKEFNSPNAAFQKGAVIYNEEPSGKVMAAIMTMGAPQANFESEGFEINNIEIVK